MDIVRLYLERHGKPDYDLLRRAVEIEALPESWRGIFEQAPGLAAIPPTRISTVATSGDLSQRGRICRNVSL